MVRGLPVARMSVPLDAHGSLTLSAYPPQLQHNYDIAGAVSRRSSGPVRINRWAAVTPARRALQSRRPQTIQQRHDHHRQHSNRPQQFCLGPFHSFPALRAHAYHERPPGLSVQCEVPQGAAALGLCRRHRPPHYARIQACRFGGDETRRVLANAFDVVKDVQQLKLSGVQAKERARLHALVQMRRREMRVFISQNCWGVKTDSRITHMLDSLGCRHAFAAFLQETWRGVPVTWSLRKRVTLSLHPAHKDGRCVRRRRARLMLQRQTEEYLQADFRDSAGTPHSASGHANPACTY